MKHTNNAQTSRSVELPATILRDIAWRIEGLGDMCRFARCSTGTYTLTMPRMWLLDLPRPGKPALYYAIEHGDLDLAEKALTKYQEAGAHGMFDGSAVKWDTFKWRTGAPAEAESMSPVMLAVESGSLAMLKLVVTHPAKCPIDLRCRGGRYDRFGHPSPVGYLHRKCIAWNRKFDAAARTSPQLRHLDNGDVYPCESALHWAVRAGRPDMLRFLLKRGAKAGLEARDAVDSRSCVMHSLLSMVLRGIHEKWRAEGCWNAPMDLVDIHMLSILHEYHAKRW
jgi:hypothetical protein